MLARLGKFQFELIKIPMNSIGEKIDGAWTESDRIRNLPLAQKNKKSAIELSIQGNLIMKKEYSLDKLKAMTKSDQAYHLVLGSGEVLGRFIIASLSITRSLFLDDGLSRAKSFSLTLKQFAK